MHFLYRWAVALTMAFSFLAAAAIAPPPALAESLIRFGYNWKGAWSTTTRYAKDDLASYQGSTWKARVANTGQAPAIGSLYWDVFAAAATGIPLTSLYSVSNVLAYGAVADGTAGTPTDNRAAFVSALAAVAASHGTLYIPAGTYYINNNVLGALTLPRQCTIQGDGSQSSVLKFAGPGFTNPTDGTGSDAFVDATVVRDLQLLGSDTIGATVGTNHAFNLTRVTNASRFQNLFINKFNGDGFKLSRPVGGTDNTAAGNAVFDQCFIICNGYAFDVNGFVNAVFSMIDANNCHSGCAYFTGGISNQAQITFNSLWWEGSNANAGANAITLDTMANQIVNLVGCQFNGHGSGDVVHVQGASAAQVNFIGCAATSSGGVTFTNWLNDIVTSPNVVIPISSRINRIAETIQGAAMVLKGASPPLDNFNLSGTADQRLWRFVQSGNTIALQARNDLAVLQRTPLSLRFTDGLAIFTGIVEADAGLTLGGATLKVTSGAGSPEAVVTGAIGSLYLRTDGGAGTTLYIKESGVGNVGWIAK